MNKTFLTCMALAILGVITFWVAGFKGNDCVAAGAITAAGAAAWVGLIAQGVSYLRKRNLYGY